jgi:hypothetical protein
MKKIFSLLSIAFIMLQSCSSDDKGNDDNTVIADNFKPPYTVKYEVQFPIDQISLLPWYDLEINYSHESNGQFHYLTESTEGRAYLTRAELIQSNGFWSHTFLVTVDTNPLPLQIKTDFDPISNTIVYFNIYINDVLVHNEAVNIGPNPYSVPFWRGMYYGVY